MTPPLLPLPEIGDRLAAIADTLGARLDSQPTLGRSRDFARPHIEVDTAYHYVVVERGSEQSRMTTTDLDALLYRAASDMAFAAALDWEFANRRPGEDFRRQLFAREVELLARLSSDWAARKQKEIEAILRRSPYRD